MTKSGTTNISEADFFHRLHLYTGTDTLYWGYMEGHMANNPGISHEKSIAADLACGTGELAAHLARKFPRVYGIDPSAPMLKLALDRMQGHQKRHSICFHQKAPEYIKEQCDFVSAVHPCSLESGGGDEIDQNAVRFAPAGVGAARLRPNPPTLALRFAQGRVCRTRLVIHCFHSATKKAPKRGLF